MAKVLPVDDGLGETSSTVVTSSRELLIRMSAALEQLTVEVTRLAGEFSAFRDIRMLDIDKRLVVAEERLSRIQTITYGCLSALALGVLGGIITLIVWVLQGKHNG